MIDRYIYVVDDDNALRRSVQMLFEGVGSFTVRSFASGHAFLDQLPSLATGCVLLGLNIPDTDGFAVLRTLQQFYEGFQTILLSGSGNIKDAVVGMRAGAIDFIKKPYDERRLLDAVAQSFCRIQDHERDASAIQAARNGINRLSPREKAVLLGLTNGKTNKTIADELHISSRTVEIYRANLMEKLGVRSVAAAVRVAIAAGLVALVP